jgi:hypothetical protein
MQIYFLLAAVAAAAAVAITEKAKKEKGKLCLATTAVSLARLLSALPGKRNTKIRKLSCRRHLFGESHFGLFAVGL